MTTDFTHRQPTNQEVIDQFGWSAICLRNLGKGNFEFVVLDMDGNEIQRDIGNPTYPRAKPIVYEGRNRSIEIARECCRCSDAAHWVLRSWELLED